MSEFDTSHHVHFKESGQKQEFSVQNWLFQSKSGQQSQPFYFKTAYFGQRRLVFGHFFLFQTEIYTLFCSKTGSEDDEKFQIHSFCNIEI